MFNTGRLGPMVAQKQEKEVSGGEKRLTDTKKGAFPESCSNFLLQNTTAMFAETVKNLRLQQRLTLRDFCGRLGLDPGNWSKVERGVNPPPGDITLLERLASFFNLSGQEKLSFMDSAAIQRREIPQDIADSAVLQKALPAFFRAARGHELTQEEIQSLAEDIRRLNTPDPV